MLVNIHRAAERVWQDKLLIGVTVLAPAVTPSNSTHLSTKQNDRQHITLATWVTIASVLVNRRHSAMSGNFLTWPKDSNPGSVEIETWRSQWHHLYVYHYSGYTVETQMIFQLLCPLYFSSF